MTGNSEIASGRKEKKTKEIERKAGAKERTEEKMQFRGKTERKKEGERKRIGNYVTLARCQPITNVKLW